MKPKVLVIVGPTASGKTALSIEVAKSQNGEIVSADSMQIYKDMDIGTAKVMPEEAQGIKHYLIDFVSPAERYTVCDFKRDSQVAVEEILQKGKLPIVVGGTGLYVNSLIYDINYSEMEFDALYRKQLMKQAETAEGLQYLYEKACCIDEKAMQKISRNDKKRIIRVLEIYHSTGKTKTEQELLSKSKEIQYDFRVFGLYMEREVLYHRINQRVDRMIENGLIEEVKKICEKYKTFPTAMQGLGYKEVVEYLKGVTTKEEMIEKIKQQSRRYAKRQLTWFRKNKEITWLDASLGLPNNVNIILEGIK